jgi:hypothetical protein
MGRRDRFDHICHLVAIAMVQSETWPRMSFFELLRHVMTSPKPAAAK